jgi:chromatin segregation and condensation protein Rec8/ScpA/Scc1 (kleisin family)
LAILELGKEGLIEIFQSEPYTEIRVRNAGYAAAEKEGR